MLIHAGQRRWRNGIETPQHDKCSFVEKRAAEAFDAAAPFNSSISLSLSANPSSKSKVVDRRSSNTHLRQKSLDLGSQLAGLRRKLAAGIEHSFGDLARLAGSVGYLRDAG